MTQEQYYRNIGEKINKDSTAEVDFLQMLRLIFLYDKKLNKNSQDADFNKINEKATELFYIDDGKNKEDALLSLLKICSDETKEAFLNAKDDNEGLFKIHNAVVLKELELKKDQKESIKEARRIESRELETKDAKEDYIVAKENAQSANKFYYNKVTYSAFLSGRGITNSEKLAEKLKMISMEYNSKLNTIENKYFSRVIEDVVNEDCRLRNDANDLKIELN